jgi:predicted phosphodiesterase
MPTIVRSIGVIGDTHGSVELINAAVSKAEDDSVDLIVQVGDFCFDQWLHQDFWAGIETPSVPMLVIDGNHDSIVHHINNKECASPNPLLGMAENIFYVQRGTELLFDNIRCVFFGGAVSIDRSIRIVNESWWAEEVPDEDDWRMLGLVQPTMSADRRTVMFTHDAPWGLTLTNAFSSHSKGNSIDADTMRRELRTHINRIRPNVLCHGHYHVNYTESVDFTNPSQSPFTTLVKGLGCTISDIYDRLLVS